jgi:glycosidase
MRNAEALKELNSLLKLKIGKKKYNYMIPSVWLDTKSGFENVNVDPNEFYSNRISKILKCNDFIRNRQKDLGGNWSSKASVYNIFIRLTTAYDHNGNGKVDLPCNKEGWSEVGTFLKTIAILPYIKYLGMDTLHLLPITAIGSDGHKGRLGSPYAIKNPYEIDPNLAEGNINLSPDVQFLAFVEAAKRMGFRIVLEFVFRTSAKDGDWVKEHPEWFYWIKDEIEVREHNSFDENKYGSPIFIKKDLEKIHFMINNKEMQPLPEPHHVFKDMFTETPLKVEHQNGKYIGETKNGKKVKIPGAFADWEPDDNQPPWSDVTYLKMYDDKRFNYIAYNTIRMYDSRLAVTKNINKKLWEKITNIIPYYQKKFGIDGVMVDMGHALPSSLLKKIQKKARDNNHFFAFWEENFSLTKKSIKEGYNVALGYLWNDEHVMEKLKNFFYRIYKGEIPLSFFATPETHNTPRAITRDGGLKYSLLALKVNAFLPGLFFIHSGYELGVDCPVNTGLGFSNEEQEKYPTEELPLFNESSFNWNNSNRFIDELAKVSEVRKKYLDMISSRENGSFHPYDFKDSKVIGYIRAKDKKVILVIVNFDFDSSHSIRIDSKKSKALNLFTNKTVYLKNETVSIKPGEVIVLLFSQRRRFSKKKKF